VQSKKFKQLPTDHGLDNASIVEIMIKVIMIINI